MFGSKVAMVNRGENYIGDIKDQIWDLVEAGTPKATRTLVSLGSRCSFHMCTNILSIKTQFILCN